MIGVVMVSALVASYSAPLTRVHIDTDEVHHTPQLVYVRDESPGAVTFQLEGEALQYILQIDRAQGFGAQLSAAVGRAEIGLREVPTPGGLGGQRGSVTGVVYGGQARLYAELFSADVGLGRPHALTLFANFRAVHYGGSDDGRSVGHTQLSSGVGLMAELVCGRYVSVLPYAWFSPSLYHHRRYDLGATRDVNDDGVSLARPLRVGLDVWIYPFGAASPSHFSASVIASLIDTSGNGAQETAVVVGWTF